MEVCDSLTALSVESGLSPSPGDTTPAQQPAPPPCAPGWKRMWDWQRGQRKGCLESGQGRRGWVLWILSLCDSLHDCKASGGIRKCHSASTTTSRWHFIYQWAFLANYKCLFILIGRIKMSPLQQGTSVIGSRLFVLGLCASCIWEVVKKLHTPCYILIFKKHISDDRKAENKLQMLDEKLIDVMNTWSCFFTRKKQILTRHSHLQGWKDFH